MKKALVSLVLAAALGMSVAACGGDEDEKASAPAEPKAPAEPQKESAGGTRDVTIKDTKFDPADAKAKVGQTVVWTNEDPIPHTVTYAKGPGPQFDSGNLDQDATFKRKFSAAGKIDYLCTIHPGQEGSLTITK